MIEYRWYKNCLDKDARYIRETVFCNEQGVMLEEDFDGSDDHSEGVIMYINDNPVATGRIIIGDRGEALIGRIACLKEYRGQGNGSLLVKELLRRCKEKGFDTVYVHSQIRARQFYEKLGFTGYGDIFMDANIPHINMSISLY